MRACGLIGASSSREPAGISTTSVPGAWRGRRLPQVAQNWLVNRFASGGLNERSCSSPWSQRSSPGWRKRFEACPVPVALRHREQWQWKKRFASPVASYFTAPHRQLPFSVVWVMAFPVR